MNKKILITAALFGVIIYISSCYKNREDIQSLPRISFRSEVVPIVTAGPCGCHNNGISSRAVQFSHAGPTIDTIFYDAILSRRSLIEAWVNGGSHPGGGYIDFEASEKLLIKRWIDQGEPWDDGGGCTVTGTVTYNADINPIYTTTCKGATCHGGVAIALTYEKLVEKKSTLTEMMNSGGSTGHPGGAISLSTCTINKIKAWITQGQPRQ